MKKLCLLFTVYGLLFTGGSQAFWTNTENLERLSQNVAVDYRNGQAQITIVEVIKNTSETTQSYQYLHASNAAQSAKFYLDGAGISVERFIGPRLLERLWDLSNTNKALLQLGAAHESGVLLSEDMELVPGEEIELKLQYLVTPELVDQFYTLSIDVGDRLPSLNHNFTFNYADTNLVKHFLPPYSGETFKEQNSVVWRSQGTNKTLNQPLNFAWSGAETATLSYRYQDYDYHLHLEPTPTPSQWETVTILIDQSGSMFGEKWAQSQLLVQQFLKTLPPNTRIQVGFFDNELSWFHDLPVENSTAEQKKLFEWWEYQIPTGTSDWSLFQEVLRDLQVQQNADSKNAGIVIGDFTRFALHDEEYFQLKSFRRNLLLDFSANDLAAFWSRLNDGRYAQILSEDTDLVQWDSIWQQWQNLYLAKTPSDLRLKNPTHSDWFPNEINYFDPNQSLLWVSRSRPNEKTNISWQADFIPGLWAQHRVASDLRRLAITKTLTTEHKSALHSIIRVLGVSHSLIDPRLGLEELFASLEALALAEIWDLIWTLESADRLNEGLFFQNGKPLINDSGTWFSADFENDFGVKSGIQTVAKSQAQQKLFSFFPDLLSTAFSLGDRVKYCSTRRCINLGANGSTELQETEKLDWRAALPVHWSNQYFLTLARENIVSVDPWGNQDQDTPVTRGEFIRWLVESYFGTDFTERTAPIGDPRFSDITNEDSITAQATYLLRRKGVIQGYPDGTVRLDKPLARAEAVKIILALDGFTPSGEHEGALPFRDITGWEGGWVVEAHKTGLVQGYGDGTFKPFQPLTKAEGMKLVVTFDQ